MKLINLNGRKFGRLTAIKDAGRSPRNNALWLCRCTCGKEVVVNCDHLIQGKTRSCGCLKKEVAKERRTTHGLSKTRLYGIWGGIKKRCLNHNGHAYKNYGGRGIKVCEEWMGFELFYEWAVANGYADNLTIERIDNDGNYEPGNCRWIPLGEQARNLRTNHVLTYKGETHCINKWAEILKIKKTTLWNRIKQGWDTEEAFARPVRRVLRCG